MKKLLLLLLTGVFLITGKAQSLDLVKDPEAKDLIDSLLKKANKFEAIYSEFTFTFEDEQEQVNDSYDGQAWIKDDSYKLILMGQTIFCDGHTIYTLLDDVGEVNITTRDTLDDSFLNNPRKLFYGYEKNYKYKYLKETVANGITVVEIELYPIILDQGLFPESGSGIDVSRINMRIDKTNLELLAIKYFGKKGTNFTIKFNYIESKNLADEFFKFDLKNFPDVEMIDLRDE